MTWSVKHILLLECWYASVQCVGCTMVVVVMCCTVTARAALQLLLCIRAAQLLRYQSHAARLTHGGPRGLGTQPQARLLSGQSSGIIGGVEQMG
jgi:hypothetical protein